MTPYFEGLTYTLMGSSAAATTDSKPGIPHYNGSACGFEEWRFKVESKYNAINMDPDERVKTQKLAEFAAMSSNV